LNVRRTVSSGKVLELAKTSRSRRQVPLSPRALEALDGPARLDTRLLFPAERGGLLNLDNFRRRERAPAIAGVRCSQASEDLRPPLHVRLERARRRHRRVRAGAGHGHLDRDDRAPLRDAAHRRGGRVASRLGAFEAEQERSGDEMASEDR
jgi:integrase